MNKKIVWIVVLLSFIILVAAPDETLEQKFASGEEVGWQDMNAALESNPQLAHNYLEQNPNYLSNLNGRERKVILGKLILEGGEKNLNIVGKHFNKFGDGTQNANGVNKNRQEFGRFLTKVGKGPKYDLSKLKSSKILSWDGENLEWEESGVKEGDSCYKSAKGEVTCGKKGKEYKKPKKTRKKFNTKKAKNVKSVSFGNEGAEFEEQDGNKVTIKGSGELDRTELKDGTSYSLIVQGTPCTATVKNICLDTITHSYKTNPKKPTRMRVTVDDSGNLEAENVGNGVGRVTSTLQDGQTIDARVRSGKINIRTNGDTTATDAKVTFTEPQPVVGGTTHRIADGNFGRVGDDYLLLTGKPPTTLTDVSARRTSQITTNGEDVDVHTNQDAPADKSGKNEVWLNQDAESYRVTSTGKVKYVQVRVDSLGNPIGNDKREPSFTGEKDSEFNLEQKGVGALALTKFKVNGKGQYEDGDKRLTTQQQNSQVEQSFSAKGNTDYLRVRCYECKNGVAATAELKIFGTTQETRDVLNPLTGEVRKVVVTNIANQPKLPISFNVKEGKISPKVDSKKLGRLQDFASFAAVRQSKNLVIGVPGGSVGAIDGNIVFQSGKKKSSINLGLAKQLGNEQLLRDAPETQRTLQALAQFAEQGTVPELQGREAKAFQQATGIDPRIKSPEYRQKIQEGIQQFAAISKAQEALRKEGYEFDENGKCLAPRGCEERFPPGLVSLRYNLQKEISKQKAAILRADLIAAKEKKIDPDLYIGEFDEKSIAAALKQEKQFVAEEEALAKKEENEIDRARGWERVVSGEYNDEEKRVLSNADAIGQDIEKAERGIQTAQDVIGPIEARLRLIDSKIRNRFQIRESDPVKREIAIQEALNNHPDYNKLKTRLSEFQINLLNHQDTKNTAIVRLTELQRTSPTYTHGELLRQAAGRSEAANDKSEYQRKLHQQAIQSDRAQFENAETAGIQIAKSTSDKAKGKEAYSLTQIGQYAKARQIASELEPGAGYTAYIDGMAKYKLEGGEAALLAKLEAERQLRIARGKLKEEYYDPEAGFFPDFATLGRKILSGEKFDDRDYGGAYWLSSNTLTDAGILVTDALSPSIWYQAATGQTETQLAEASIKHFEGERLEAQQAMTAIMASRSSSGVSVEIDGIQVGGGTRVSLPENSFTNSDRFQYAVKSGELSKLDAEIEKNPTAELIAQREILAKKVKVLQLGKSFEDLEAESRVVGKYAVYGKMLKLEKQGGSRAAQWTRDNAMHYVGDVVSTGVEFAGADPFIAITAVSALNKARKVLNAVDNIKEAERILTTTGDIAASKRALDSTRLQQVVGSTKNKAAEALFKKREVPGYKAASAFASKGAKKITPQSVQRGLATAGDVITRDRYVTQAGRRTALLKQADARQNQLDSLKQQAQLPESSLHAAGTSPQQVRSQIAKAEETSTDAWKQFDTVNDDIVATAEAKALARDSRRISDSKLASVGISRQELEATQLAEVVPSSRVPEPAMLKSVDNKGSKVTRDGSVTSDSFTTGDKAVADRYEPKGGSQASESPNACGFAACAFASVGAGACGCDFATEATQPVPPKEATLRDLLAELDFADSPSVSIADIPAETPPVLLQAAPPAAPPRVAALENPAVRQEVSSNIIAISRANGEEKIAQRYASHKLRGTEPVIPKWGRKIREDQLGDVANLNKGAVSSNWGSGDIQVVYGSGVEKAGSAFVRGDGFTRMNVDAPDPTDIAFIVVPDNKVAAARKAVGGKYEIVPASMARQEEAIVKAARLDSADRANVIAEGGHRLASPYTHEVARAKQAGISRKQFAERVTEKLQAGDVMEKNGVHYVVNPDGKNMKRIAFHTVDTVPVSAKNTEEILDGGRRLGRIDHTADTEPLQAIANGQMQPSAEVIPRGDTVPKLEFPEPVDPAGVYELPPPLPSKIVDTKVSGTAQQPALLAQDDRIPDLIPQTYNEDDFVSPLHAAYYDLYRQKKVASVTGQPAEMAIPQNILDYVASSKNLENPFGGTKFFFVESKGYKSGQGKIRFYVNAKDADSAQDIMLDTAKALEAEGIPFSMKTSLGKDKFATRVDNTVLYVPPEHRLKVQKILEKVHAEKPTHFDPESPLLTKQLAPGLSWAEHPTKGKSFGEIRSRALAEARVASEGKSADEIEQITKQIFEKYDVDYDNPHLNVGSKNKELPIEITPAKPQDTIPELPAVAVDELPPLLPPSLGKVSNGKVYEPEGFVWNVRDGQTLSQQQLEALGDDLFSLDGVVRDAETGQKFYVTSKGVNEQQLAAELGNFLAQRAGVNKLRYPEMRTADFGEGRVLLSEFAEGSHQLSFVNRDAPIGQARAFDANVLSKADPEAGRFATVQNLWFRNWDFKAQHMLVDPDTGVMTVIDLEKGFGGGLDDLLFGLKPHPDGLDGHVLARMAEFSNPHYTDNIDDFEDALKVIEGMTDQDYNTIRSMARKAGFDDINTERIVIELQQRQKTIRKDLENVLQQAKQRPQIPTVTNPDTIPKPPSLEKLVTIQTDKLNPSTKNFLEEHGFVAVVDRKGDSKDLTDEIELAMKGSIADELGIGQTKELVDAQGKRWFVKLGLDDATEAQGIELLVRDNARRHKALENILRHEFGLHVPETKIVKGQDGFTYIISPKLDNYHGFRKDSPHLEWDDFVKKHNLEPEEASIYKDIDSGLPDFIEKNNIDPEDAARLQREMDLHSVINTQFRATDVELGVAKFDGEWHITRIDDEFAFSGLIPGQGNPYIMPHQVQRWSPQYDLKDFKFGGNDEIFTSFKRSDFYQNGDFDWNTFDSRLGNHINNVEDVVHTEAGRARLRGYLMDAGYSEFEANNLISQAQGLGILEDEIGTIIQADGIAVVDDGRKLISEEAFKEKYLPKETNVKPTDVTVASDPPRLELVVPKTVKRGGAPKIDGPIVDRNSVSNVVDKKALSVVPQEAKPDLRVLAAEEKRVSNLPASTPDEILEKEISLRELLVEARKREKSDTRDALIEILEDELDVLAGQRQGEVIPPCNIPKPVNLVGQAAAPCFIPGEADSIRKALGERAPIEREYTLDSPIDDYAVAYVAKKKDVVETGSFDSSDLDNLQSGFIDRLLPGRRIYVDALSSDANNIGVRSALYDILGEFDGAARFSINARDSDAGMEIMKELVKKLKKEGVSFELKISRNKAHFSTRVDNTNLIVHPDDVEKAERILQDLSINRPELLDTEIPTFSQPIASGIGKEIHGFNRQFRTQRAAAIADLHSITNKRGNIPDEELEQITKEVLIKRNVHPEEPWRDLGFQDTNAPIKPERIIEVYTPERTVQIQRVMKHADGILVKSDNNLYRIDKNGVKSVVYKAEDNVGKQTRTYMEADKTIPFVEENPELKGKLQAIFNDVHDGRLIAEDVSPDEASTIFFQGVLRDNPQFSLLVASGKYDGAFINPFGTHAKSVERVREITKENDVLRHINEVMETKGVQKPRFNSKQNQLVDDEIVTTARGIYSPSSNVFDETGTIYYRVFSSEGELFQAARGYDYYGKDLEEARKVVQEGTARISAGHETFHHVWHSVLTPEQKKKWTAMVLSSDNDNIWKTLDNVQSSKLYERLSGQEEMWGNEVFARRMHAYTFGADESTWPARFSRPDSEEVSLLKEFGILPESYRIPIEDVPEGSAVLPDFEKSVLSLKQGEDVHVKARVRLNIEGKETQMHMFARVDKLVPDAVGQGDIFNPEISGIMNVVDPYSKTDVASMQFVSGDGSIAIFSHDGPVDSLIETAERLTPNVRKMEISFNQNEFRELQIMLNNGVPHEDAVRSLSSKILPNLEKRGWEFSKVDIDEFGLGGTFSLTKGDVGRVDEVIPPCKIGNIAGGAAGIPCGAKATDIDRGGLLGNKLGNWLSSKEGKDFLDTEVGQAWYENHKKPWWKTIFGKEVDIASVGDDLPFEFARSQNLDPLKLGDFKKSRQSIENIVYGPESIVSFQEYGLNNRAYYNRLIRKNGASVTYGPLDQAEFSALTGAEAFPPLEGFIGVNHPDFPYNPPTETSKFYFNSKDSGSAGGIAEYMVKQMQHEGIVYQLKTVADRSGYGHRVDNTVLYVSLGEGDRVERIIRSVSFEGLVDPEVQILTKKIANGISRADSPTNIIVDSSRISVGQMKSNALDEIRHTIQGRALDEKDLVNIWDNVMKKHGLDPDEPWKLLDQSIDSSEVIPPCKIGNIAGRAIGVPCGTNWKIGDSQFRIDNNGWEKIDDSPLDNSLRFIGIENDPSAGIDEMVELQQKASKAAGVNIDLTDTGRRLTDTQLSSIDERVKKQFAESIKKDPKNAFNHVNSYLVDHLLEPEARVKALNDAFYPDVADSITAAEHQARVLQRASEIQGKSLDDVVDEVFDEVVNEFGEDEVLMSLFDLVARDRKVRKYPKYIQPRIVKLAIQNSETTLQRQEQIIAAWNIIHNDIEKLVAPTKGQAVSSFNKVGSLSEIERILHSHEMTKKDLLDILKSTLKYEIPNDPRINFKTPLTLSRDNTKKLQTVNEALESHLTAIGAKDAKVVFALGDGEPMAVVHSISRQQQGLEPRAVMAKTGRIDMMSEGERIRHLRQLEREPGAELTEGLLDQYELYYGIFHALDDGTPSPNSIYGVAIEKVRLQNPQSIEASQQIFLNEFTNELKNKLEAEPDSLFSRQAERFYASVGVGDEDVIFVDSGFKGTIPTFLAAMHRIKHPERKAETFLAGVTKGFENYVPHKFKKRGEVKPIDYMAKFGVSHGYTVQEPLLGSTSPKDQILATIDLHSMVHNTPSSVVIN